METTRTPPLGSIPGMRWCGETNRYYANAVNQQPFVGLERDISGYDSIRAPRDAALECVRKAPVGERLLRTLPSYGKKRSRADSEDCAICLRRGLDGKTDPRHRFISLPCKHSFHYYCAAEWLTKRSGSCPVCRTPVDTSLAVAAKTCY